MHPGATLSTPMFSNPAFLTEPSFQHSASAFLRATAVPTGTAESTY